MFGGLWVRGAVGQACLQNVFSMLIPIIACDAQTSHQRVLQLPQHLISHSRAAKNLCICHFKRFVTTPVNREVVVDVDIRKEIGVDRDFRAKLSNKCVLGHIPCISAFGVSQFHSLR